MPVLDAKRRAASAHPSTVWPSRSSRKPEAVPSSVSLSLNTQHNVRSPVSYSPSSHTIAIAMGPHLLSGAKAMSVAERR